MEFLKYILFILFVFGAVISLEGAIRKYPEGDKLYRDIASGSMKFFQWVAEKNARASLEGLSKLLFKLMVILIFIFAVFVFVFKTQISLRYSILFIIIFYLWASINWLFKPWEQIKEIAPWISLVVISPYIILLINFLTPLSGDHLSILKDYMSANGFPNRESNLYYSFWLSLILLVSALFFVFLMGIFFILPAGIIFFAIFLSTKICKYFVIKRSSLVYYLIVFYFLSFTIYSFYIFLFP